MIADQTALRRVARGLGALAVALAAWAEATTPAWATFHSAATASSTVSSHQLLAPTLSCGLVGVGSVTLTWTAPADTLLADVYGTGFLTDGYEVAGGSTSGGPYSAIATTAATTYTVSGLSNGTHYFVVRTTKKSWRSAGSNARTATVARGVTTCL